MQKQLMLKQNILNIDSQTLLKLLIKSLIQYMLYKHVNLNK
jgi:hypothetical protein